MKLPRTMWARFHLKAAIHYRSMATLYQRENYAPAARSYRALMRDHAKAAVRTITPRDAVATGDHFFA